MMLFARAVSGRLSMTSPMRQVSLPRVRRASATALISPVALFTPGIPVVVVAQGFPEAGFVVTQEPQASDPLGALPEVQVRHEQARRATVLGLQGLTLVG